MHEPDGYECTERNRQADIVWRDDATTAFSSPKWWAGNHGHVIVIPKRLRGARALQRR